VIDAEKASYKIAWMCRLLGVPRSSFYAWRNRAETATAARRRELAVRVKAAFEGGRGAYGCRRVAAQLNRDGHPCSVGLVADLMRELGLRACQPRAYKRTTVPGEQPASPDLIGRDFTAAVPGTRLVGDITYLQTGEGWLYLATVIDLATRMVTGWQLADHMRTSLVTDALAMAMATGTPSPARSSTAIRERNIPRRSSPGSASRAASAPAPGGPGCAGTTPPPKASSAR
jgi:putative transposase